MTQDDFEPTPNQTPDNRLADFESANPQGKLNIILNMLKSSDAPTQLEGLRLLYEINFSSEAIRLRVEELSLRGENLQVQDRALKALGLETHQFIRKRLSPLELNRNIRELFLAEIRNWADGGLINNAVASVLRRRYDFDLIAPTPRDQAFLLEVPPTVQPEPELVKSVQPVEPPAPAKPQAPVETQAIAETQTPIEPQAPIKTFSSVKEPQQPATPRPTLLQALTSESSVKIYLYLGAFFVIAAALILSVVVPELRLPVLILGTLIFGGLAVAIKKRLPQPSFALFIVFSFLLPITGNILEESLRSTLNYSAYGTTFVWAILFLFMALVWSGGAYLYQSRLFSLTAFGAFMLAARNIAALLGSEPELYTLIAALAVFSGWAGARFLRKWKDAAFAFPLFISAQLMQLIILGYSISTFTIRLFDGYTSSPYWHLVALCVWILASLFYFLSEREKPGFIFEWLSVGALIPLPWFVIAAFQADAVGASAIFFVWGAALIAASEGLFHFEARKKFSLPSVLAGLITLASGLISAFTHEAWLILLIAFGIGLVLTGLHAIRSRQWLWALALLNFCIAYFAFFNLEVVQSLKIALGYQILVLSLLFLSPDLLLKRDWNHLANWRWPVRIYGAFFVVIAYLNVATTVSPNAFSIAAVVFTVYAVFFGIYALAYRKAWLGYLSTSALPLALISAFSHFNVDIWLPALTALVIGYFLFGLAIRTRVNWSLMFRYSALIIGALMSLTALILFKETGGWYVFIIGLLFGAEMFLRRDGLFELGAPILFNVGAFLILRDFKVSQAATHLLVYSLIWLSVDIIMRFTFKYPRPLSMILQIVGGIMTSIGYFLLLFGASSAAAAFGFAIYTLFFGVYALIHRKAWLGYLSTSALPLTLIFAFRYFNVDVWLPALTVLAVGYFLFGLAIRTRVSWSLMLRYSALVVGALMSLTALILFKETGGWYVFIIGLLFSAEMFLRKDGLLELGAPILFNIGAYLILRDFEVIQITTHLLVYSLIWLSVDLIMRLTFKYPRPFSAILQVIGGIMTLTNYFFLFVEASNAVAALNFAIYTLFFLIFSLLRKNPTLFYAFTITLPIFAAFLFRLIGFDKWIHPAALIALAYYAVGYFSRRQNFAAQWGRTLTYSGLGLGVLVSFAASSFPGADAALPVAIGATLWDAEAFAKKNVNLAFPANGLYLWSYFILLYRLNVTQPQFFSIGAALLGIFQHYLLTRAGSKTGAFVIGMLSQFVLIGTSYIQMVSQNELIYLFILFIQSMAVLTYGIVIRSRSLTLFPIGFVVIAVITVVAGQLQELATILLVGCAGIFLLVIGILAVLLRERIAKLSEKLREWQA